MKSLVILCIILFILVLTLCFVIGKTVEANITIPTLNGWEYRGEGYPHKLTIENCYGITEDTQYMIGDVEITSPTSIYTPIPCWFGFETVTLIDGNGRGYLINYQHEFKVYSKQIWFITRYLVICK